ncbi:hypothetical protein IC801_08745 [Geobacillus sp. 44B]|nr:hypothetical protein IC801_08745 [Geobacillus sp. 44B]
MDKKFLENIINRLENATVVPPRELFLYQGGEGIIHRCLDRYIQMQLKEHSHSEGLLRVYCSNVTEEEERFFDNVLFDLLFNPYYVYDAELYVILEEFSELVGITSKRVSNLLDGLSRLRIEMRVPPYEKINSVHGSWIFPESKTGRCFNIETGEYDAEEHYFKMRINPAFLKACLEVKHEMSQ